MPPVVEQEIVTLVPEVVDVDPPDASCHPDYGPYCVPDIAGDLNCADLPYRVELTGQGDDYGLDRDGDGIGCESLPVFPG